MTLMTFTQGESRRSEERTKARLQKKQQEKERKERKEREWRKYARSNAPTRSSSRWTSAPEWQRGWHEAPKAPEPGPAAVAARLGVYHLVLEDHCAPPDASAVCQRHDTGCHAISWEQWLARETYFGEFSGDVADFAGGVDAEQHVARRFASPGGPAPGRVAAYVCAERQRPPALLA